MVKDLKYYEITKDILNHSEFLKSKDIKHHEGSIYQHSVDVSYKAYLIGKKLRLDYKSIARAGLLHDFFLYDWRKSGNRNIKNFKNSHAVTHPKLALKNAKKYFEINNIEEDIIKRHMFPATITPPRYLESWIVTLVDKYLAIREYSDGFDKKLGFINKILNFNYYISLTGI